MFVLSRQRHVRIKIQGCPLDSETRSAASRIEWSLEVLRCKGRRPGARIVPGTVGYALQPRGMVTSMSCNGNEVRVSPEKS